MAEIARLFATIGANTQPLQRGLGSARGALGSFASQAGASLSGVGKAADNLGGHFQGIGSHAEGAGRSIQTAMQGAHGAMDGISARAVAVGTALGNLAAQAITAGWNMGKGVVNSAFDAVKGYETMSKSIETLTAREIYNASAVQKQVLVGYRNVAATQAQTVWTGKAKMSTEQLALKERELANNVAKAEEALGKKNATLSDAKTGNEASATSIETSAIALEKAKQAQAGFNAQLKQVPASAGGTVAVYKTVEEHTLTMAEAQKQAAVKAQETLSWIQKLAIQSPFGRDDVATAYKTAQVYGFTGDEAKRLTQDLIDMGAAFGWESHMLGQVAYPLGQIRSGSKLYTQDLRQLMNAGVDVNGMLKRMGYTLEDVGKKDVSSKEFLKVFMEMTEQDFGGAGAAMAGSFAGLVASLEDLKDMALRDLFTPIFEEAKPALEGFVTALQSPAIREGLQSLGKGIGTLLKGPLELFTKGTKAVGTFLARVKAGDPPIKALGFVLKQLLPKNFHDVVTKGANALSAFQSALEKTNNPAQAIKDAIGQIFTPPTAEAIGGVIDKASEVFTGIKTAAEKTLQGGLSLVGMLLAGASPEALGKKAGEIVGGLIDSLSAATSDPEMLNKVGAAFLTWGNAALSVFNMAVPELVGPLTNFANNIGVAAGRAIGTLLQSAGPFFASLLGFPQLLTEEQYNSAAAQFGRNLGTAFSNIGELLNAIGAGLGTGIIKGLGDSLKIPPEVMAKVMPALQKGIENVKPEDFMNPQKTGADLMKGAAEAFANDPAIQKGAEQAAKNLDESFRDAYKKTGGIAKAFQGAQEALSGGKSMFVKVPMDVDVTAEVLAKDAHQTDAVMAAWMKQQNIVKIGDRYIRNPSNPVQVDIPVAYVTANTGGAIAALTAPTTWQDDYNEQAINIPAGVKAGVDAGASEAIGAIGAMNDGMKMRFLNDWQMHSPSEFTRTGGLNITAGLAQGITEGMGAIVGSFTGVQTAFSNMITGMVQKATDSAVWQNAGLLIDTALATGIRDNAGMVLGALNAIADQFVQGIMNRIANQFGKQAQGAY